MTTYMQLVFILHVVATKAQSLNSLCKILLLLDEKLSQLRLTELPASSPLAYANCE